MTEGVKIAYRITLQIIWPIAVAVTRHTAILGVIESILFTPVTQPARDIRLAVTRASHVVAHVTDGANRRTVTTWKGVKYHDVRWLKTMLLSNLTKKYLLAQSLVDWGPFKRGDGKLSIEKPLKCFRSTLQKRNSKTQLRSFCFKKTRVVLVFKMFCPHKSEKLAFSNSFALKGVYET